MTKYFTKNDEGEYNEVDHELLTQEQVDGVVKSRAERIAKQEFADYDELKEKAAQVDSISTDFEAKLTKATDKVADLEKQLGEKDTEIDKIKLASEFKLNDDMLEFITGDTAEERRRRAEKLANNTPTGDIPIDKTNSRKDTESGTNKDLARRLFGTSDD